MRHPNLCPDGHGYDELTPVMNFDSLIVLPIVNGMVEIHSDTERVAAPGVVDCWESVIESKTHSELRVSIVMVQKRIERTDDVLRIMA